MKRKDGKNYQEPSYYDFRAAIHRQLVELERNFNVYSDPEFRQSNNVLDGVLKKLRREGKMEPFHHKQPITKSDMDKIQFLFDHDKGQATCNDMCGFHLPFILGYVVATKSVSCLNVRVLCYVEVACLEYRPYNYVVACNVVPIGNLNHNHVDLGTGFMAESRPGTHDLGHVLGRTYQALIQP